MKDQQQISAKMFNKIILLFSTVALIVLFIATAFGKLYFPNPKLIYLDSSAGVFEIILACLLAIFHRRRLLWLGMALVFAAWGGYSLYWTSSKMSCGCFGEMFEVPIGFSFGLDVFLWGWSLFVAFLQKATAKEILFFAFLSFLMGWLSYLFADWILQEILMTGNTF